MSGAFLERLQSSVSWLTKRVGHDSAAVRMFRPPYETFLEAASGGRGIPWEINGESFRIDPRHRHRMGHEYEPEVAAAICERLSPGMTFVDVGANVGVYALQMARVVGPRGRVVAFEPNPAALQCLTRHVRLNGFEDRVTIVPLAVGIRAGTATLFTNVADGMSRLDEPNPFLRSTQSVSTRVESLDNYFDTEGQDPDVLLIDVEGYEIDVLAGARRLIERSRRKLSIFVEMHPAAWDWGTSGTDARGLLAELGLRPVPLTGQSDPLEEYGSVELVASPGSHA
ncbi:MAG: FkbM family methyltransferase [Gemmatimonadales bacterium]